MAILSTVTGRPWRPNVFSTKVSLWLSEHPTMEGCTYHGLRHTAAAHLAEAGALPHEIQVVTGHRNLSTVARYTHGLDQRAAAEEAVRKLTKRRVTR
jgi:integrase/recombinase XerD